MVDGINGPAFSLLPWQDHVTHTVCVLLPAVALDASACLFAYLTTSRRPRLPVARATQRTQRHPALPDRRQTPVAVTSRVEHSHVRLRSPRRTSSRLTRVSLSCEVVSIVCLSVCLSVWLSVCLIVCLSECLSVFSDWVYIWLSVCMFVRVSVCLSECRSYWVCVIRVSVGLSVCLDVCLTEYTYGSVFAYIRAE